MKKNLLSLNNLLVVALATLAATSPALAAPQIPPLQSFVMNPDGGVIVAEGDSGRVLLVNPGGQTRVLVGRKAGLNWPSAVGIRNDFLYVQDDQAIYRVLPDIHALTSKNASFQLVQEISGPDQPFIKLTSPAAEDSFSRTEPITVAWAHNLGKTARFTIECSYDNGENWETLAEVIKGNRYTWYATSWTESARLRIRQVAGPLGKSDKPSADTTDEVFFVRSEE